MPPARGVCGVPRRAIGLPMPARFSLTVRLVLPVLWLSGPIPARSIRSPRRACIGAMIASLFPFDPLLQVARFIRSSRALFCCGSILSGCVLWMPVTRNGCPVLFRRGLFSPALHLPAACRLRPSGLSGRGLAVRRLMPRPYGPGLDARAGVPLGIASLWPSSIRCRSARLRSCRELAALLTDPASIRSRSALCWSG